LGEIEFVVQKRTPREFAGLGEPQIERSTRFETALQHELQHHRSAVTLQLENMLARVRVRRGKVERNAAIENLASRIDERHITRVARSEHLAAKRLRQRVRAGLAGASERYAHDTDSTPSGSGGNGDDRI
jgi:hypothetical protein